MNVVGSSRVPPPARLALRGRVESAYEAELLEFLRELGLDELDRIQTHFIHRTHAGDALSDYDVALNDLLQQARGLAQRLAPGEDVAVQRPNSDGTATRRNSGQQRGERAARSEPPPIQRWGGWLSSMVGGLFGSKLSFKPGPTNTSTSLVICPTGHNCVVCQEPIYGKEIRAPCGHYYDIACVTKLFQCAARDETLFPPRCCRQNIPITQVQPHFSPELVTIFQQKRVEFSTLKRVYCSSPTCSRFLGPHSDGISKVYTCPGCARQTCAKCRGKHSFSWMLAWMHACRPDASTSRVLEVGRTAGWARCPGCSHMIERRQGCNHMTCRCHTEFCYHCGVRWKACTCTQRGVPSRSSMTPTPTRICRIRGRLLLLVCFILALVLVFLVSYVLVISSQACRITLPPPFPQPSCFQAPLKGRSRTYFYIR
ncbi:hypothetical protein EV363DRAFT_1316693 [Boletus edulis]|nr:hypothetical protein EV363DRAFT_1316693 [Boletus edulis]